MATTFIIRPASSALNDGDRILSYTDSQLPWLAQHGAEAQWGDTAFSNDRKSQAKYRAKVQRSEIPDQRWNRDWMKVYIAEVDASITDVPREVLAYVTHIEKNANTVRLPVAAMILSGSSADYTRPVIPAQDENDPFMYVSWVVSDRRAGGLSKGSGEALLDHAKRVAKHLGLRRLCLDCWNGNQRLLVNYYESKGFHAIGDFLDAEDDWPGTVLDLRI